MHKKPLNFRNDDSKYSKENLSYKNAIQKKDLSSDRFQKNKNSPNTNKNDIKKIITTKPYIARYLQTKQKKPISDKAAKLIASTIKNLLQEK